MEPRAAYKFAFLAKCLEDGCTEPEIQDRIKIAAERVQAGKTAAEGEGWNPLSYLWPAAKLFGGLSAAGALGAGALTGLGGGYMAAKMQDPGYTADDIKRQETLTAYNTLADELDEQREADKELSSVPAPARKVLR